MHTKVSPDICPKGSGLRSLHWSNRIDTHRQLKTNNPNAFRRHLPPPTPTPTLQPSHLYAASFLGASGHEKIVRPRNCTSLNSSYITTDW